MPSKLFFLFLSLITTNSFAQNQCFCKDDLSSNQSIRCDTTFFKNHSFLYRQFNCDSIWLTFETTKEFKKILYSIDKEMSGMTIPVDFVREYKGVLLFEERGTSAIDFPSSFFLLSKTTGKTVREIGRLIYFPSNTTHNFLLYYSDDSFNSLTLYFVDRNKEYKIPMPKKRIFTTMQYSNELYPENLFDKPIINGSEFIFRYKYLDKKDSINYKTGIVKIEINKYNR